MGNLVSRNFLPSSVFRTISQFPTLWEDLEKEFESGTGLSFSEDENNIYVEAQMPGLKVDDINVTLENGILRINRERQEHEEDKKRKFHRQASYTYNYRLALPNLIDEGSPKAVYKDGVMNLTFKKSKEAKAKRITVQNG